MIQSINVQKSKKINFYSSCEFQSLSKFVCNCLEQAASDRFSHIAFPALGTGALKFPLDVTASVMIKCVTLHESNFHDSTLTDVSIVVFDGDKNCHKVKAVSMFAAQPFFQTNEISHQI